MGYVPAFFFALLRRPRKTLSFATAYGIVQQVSPTWRHLVRSVIALGSSRRPKLVRAQTQPYDPQRQYLLAAHPHGILNYGWWNLIARYGLSLVDGLQLIMCVAPAAAYYPLYRELFHAEDGGPHRVTDASKKTIDKIFKTTNLTPAIIPGGFSEATYTAADPNVEYAYIADRVGIVRCAIEAGVDIIPAYSFGLNDMYATWSWRRHWRAVKAQAWGIPTVLWCGPFLLGNVPFTEDITVVTFDPFPASQYTLDQVAQAHADYMEYLTQCFESKKHECGAGHKRLEFIGKSKPPQAEGSPRSRL